MSKHIYFVGRQPILDAGLQCRGYELLFRQRADDDSARICNPEKASAQILLDAVLDSGLASVTEGQWAFVNVTRDFLLEGDASRLPRERLVFEVPCDMLLDDATVGAVRNLRTQGYRVAADNFHFQVELAPLLGLVDLLKVNLRLTPVADRGRLPAKGKGTPTLLADKVETQAMFEQCRIRGFDLFQGYFFCKPKVLAGRRLPPGSVAVLQLLEILLDPAVRVRDLEHLVEQDLALSYKLLRFINSPHFGFRHQIHSVQQAIVLAGLNTVRNLVALVALSQIQDKPGELALLALTRARTCELLGRQTAPKNAGSYFTVGLFSLLDALLDRPLAELLAQLPLAPEINAALLERAGPLGKTLECAAGFERGDWVALQTSGCDLEAARTAYLEAIRWANAFQQLTSG